VPWVRFEDTFDQHPKVVGLDDATYRMWTRAIAYCSRNLTDAFLSRAAAKELRPSDWARCAGKLIKAGLFELAADGYRLHDYHDYQPRRSKVLSIRKARAEAGRSGGQARAEQLFGKGKASA
jgi:hypothetical protein